MVIARLLGAIGAASAALSPCAVASAEPYRLRADAFASAADPSGFVMLQAEAREREPLLVDAEALVWTGVGLDRADDPEARGDAVLASVRLRDPVRYVDARFGRLFFQGGAIRPQHMDGAVVGFRSPTGATTEVFAGLPVAPGSAGRRCRCSEKWRITARSARPDSSIRPRILPFPERRPRQSGHRARSGCSRCRKHWSNGAAARTGMAR